MAVVAPAARGVSCNASSYASIVAVDDRVKVGVVGCGIALRASCTLLDMKGYVLERTIRPITQVSERGY